MGVQRARVEVDGVLEALDSFRVATLPMKVDTLRRVSAGSSGVDRYCRLKGFLDRAPWRPQLFAGLGQQDQSLRVIRHHIQDEAGLVKGYVERALAKLLLTWAKVQPVKVLKKPRFAHSNLVEVPWPLGLSQAGRGKSDPGSERSADQCDTTFG